jgi:hypothetical protein
MNKKNRKLSLKKLTVKTLTKKSANRVFGGFETGHCTGNCHTNWCPNTQEGGDCFTSNLPSACCGGGGGGGGWCATHGGYTCWI